ncbi:hypothetical protein CRG98_032763 [Punica granatum]|uniref:Uncharacterized protein n=1 Tax=Punica granatum TaxID=22663 RepID=A0A2I0IS50_PUNGR|nr:hypothetical protein CRG98_032763 [Punica granatum]
MKARGCHRCAVSAVGLELLGEGEGAPLARSERLLYQGTLLCTAGKEEEEKEGCCDHQDTLEHRLLLRFKIGRGLGGVGETHGWETTGRSNHGMTYDLETRDLAVLSWEQPRPGALDSWLDWRSTGARKLSL